MRDLTRRRLIVSGGAGAIIAGGESRGVASALGLLIFESVEARFLASTWAMSIKESLGYLIDNAGNDTPARVRLLHQVGVGADANTAWAIGGQEAAAAIRGIRLARLAVQHGLATEAETRCKAAELLDLWRRGGPNLHPAKTQWRFAPDLARQNGGRWHLLPSTQASLAP